MWTRRQDYTDNPSRVDAEHRTLESFNERKQWDPTSAPKAASGDNIDYEWERKTRGRNDPAMYDSWAQRRSNDQDYYDEDEDEDYEDEEYAEDEEDEDDYGAYDEEGAGYRNWRADVKESRELGKEKRRVVGDTTFTDRFEERALGPRHRERTDELYERPKLRKIKPDKENEERKKELEREWKEEGRPEKVHVVCVDETKDAERGFKYALHNLPPDHRLVLVHGVYEGLLGHTRGDEARLRRVRNKYLQTCSEQGRNCTFKHLHFTSTGNFGEEICDLAERAHAQLNRMSTQTWEQSVLVGKRTHVSGVRRALAGSYSKSVLEACRVPVSVVFKGEKGLATTGN